MFVLDTDHLTLLERGGSAPTPLRIRLRQVPAHEIKTSIVNYEEQMRGWLAEASQANTTERMLSVYFLLQGHLQMFQGIPILPFDRAAADRFDILRQAHIRIGTMNIKIAAVCLANDATLLTRNLRDFNKVPGLRAEDWSV